MTKYIFKGGAFNKSLSVARACLAHFTRHGIFTTSPDGVHVGGLGLDAVIVVPSGARTLRSEENGASVLLGAAAGQTVTLPAASRGLMRFRIGPSVDITSGSLTITPASTDTIRGARFAKTAGQTVTLGNAADAAGDFIDLVSDGTLSWYVTGLKGTWA
jgi:hypothetical protein